jgi:XTP/dITP diphosphohydrolase
MKIILSTRNGEKTKQINAMFAGTDIHILSLEDAEIEGEVEEGIESLEENASLKTMFAWRKTSWPDAWTMADDTGLFIHALGGEPGVITADWAGKEVKGAELEAFAVSKIRAIPEGQRSAYWKTVAAVREPSGNLLIFTGESGGRVIDEPRGELKPQFPYSRIFVPDDGDGRTWAQMTTEEQNAISHRGKAFEKAREFLLTRI